MTLSAPNTGIRSGIRLRMIVLAILSACIAMIMLLPTVAAGPTCSDSDIIDVENHGHHIVADYVTGEGHSDTDWPPAGSVGESIAAEGAANPGAPGIHQHGGGTFQPGASFCNKQANSPTGEDIP